MLFLSLLFFFIFIFVTTISKATKINFHFFVLKYSRKMSLLFFHLRLFSLSFPIFFSPTFLIKPSLLQWLKINLLKNWIVSSVLSITVSKQIENCCCSSFMFSQEQSFLRNHLLLKSTSGNRIVYACFLVSSDFCVASIFQQHWMNKL